MMLIAIATSLTGFYLLYNTSARADLRQDKVHLWLRSRTLLSRMLGLLTLTGSFATFAICCGPGSGILVGFITLMTTASLVIILAPLTIPK